MLCMLFMFKIKTKIGCKIKTTYGVKRESDFFYTKTCNKFYFVKADGRNVALTTRAFRYAPAILMVS